ncbi:unnamed protein product [Blepharisma stoltei]|uniref:Receptor ligand binding region domain-containing protein n=1 Tax=Blepharisma stoltei TaxID=1481888 RepID=A0AAU9JFV5_9CILI|nr:unnamed protein product [Blepharisma stoltei]
MKRLSCYLITICIRALIAASLPIFLYFSSYTPAKIKSSVGAFIDTYEPNTQKEISRIFLNENFQPRQSNFGDDIIIIIDETYNLKLSYKIQKYALNAQIPIFYTKNSSAIADNSPFTYIAHSPLSLINDAYDKLMHHFGIQKLAIVWVYTEENEFLVRFFDNDPHFEVNSIVISDNLNQDLINHIISRELKPSGIANIIVLADSENCKNIQKSLIDYNMVKSGYLIILGHSCLNNAIIDGSISILPNIDIYSSTEEESYVNNLILLLDSLENKYGNQTFTKLQFWHSFQEFKKSFVWDFTIINRKNSNFYNVGKISNGKIEIIGNIQYPGGAEDLPVSSRINILISGNVGTFNPPGYLESAVNKLYHEGTHFAVQKINTSKEILQNFYLKLNDQINCGASVWINDFANNCYLEKRSEMGVAYLASYLSSISIATLNLFKETNFSIPMVSGANSAHSLSNSTIFPAFTRISTSSDYMGKTWVIYMKVMGWTSCVLLYADDAYDVSVYQNFLQTSESQGITILNKEEFRKIPFMYNTSQLENYRKNFQEAIDQNCNIFFLFCADPSFLYVFNSLYDMGIRKGDALFLINGLTGSDLLYATPGVNTAKTAQLLNGILYLFIPEWIGTLGNKLKIEFDQLYPLHGNRIRCVHYDAVWAIAEAVQMLINSGKNYEDYHAMNSAIKNVRFRGCSGSVMIENGSNDRRLNIYSLYNSYYDNSTNKWIANEVGHFSPYSGTFFQLTNPIVWPGNSAPSTFKHYDCPYKNKKVHISIKSKLISMSICLCTVIFCILFVFFIIKVKFSYELEKISEQKYFTDPDNWMMAIIFIESLQFQGIGPSFEAFNALYYDICSVMSYNLEFFSGFKDETFWRFFYGTIFFGLFWFALQLIIVIKIEKIGLYWIYETAVKIEEIIGALMAGIFFQPILSMLLKITQCDYGSGEDLTDAFFNYDCHFSCWDSHYFSIMIPTVLIAFIYIAFSLKIRPLWQENQFDLNIKEDPACMMIKGLVQTILIAIYETLHKTNKIIHCSIFLFIMIFYLIFIAFRKCFNYDRANLFQICLTVCVIWNSILSLAYIIINTGHSYIWLIVQFLGIFTVIMCSVWAMRRLPPSILIKKEGKSILKLFRFSLMGSNFWSQSSRSMNLDQRFVNLYLNEENSNRMHSIAPMNIVDSPKMPYISDNKGEESPEKQAWSIFPIFSMPSETNKALNCSKEFWK